MDSVYDRIESWGKSNLGKSGVTRIMKHLRKKKGLGKEEIAKLLKCSVPTVRYYLAKSGIEESRSGFVTKITELGYKSLSSFFTDPKNTHRTMKELAKDLGLCYPTVSKYYHKFREEKESRHSK